MATTHTLSATLTKADALGIRWACLRVDQESRDHPNSSSFDMKVSDFFESTGLGPTVIAKLNAKRDNTVQISNFASDVTTIAFTAKNSGQPIEQDAQIPGGNALAFSVAADLEFSAKYDNPTHVTTFDNISGLSIKVHVVIVDVVAKITKISSDADSKKITITYEI